MKIHTVKQEIVQVVQVHQLAVVALLVKELVEIVLQLHVINF
jgi:hypothetical protein